MKYDKDEIKNSLSLEDIFSLLLELRAEPILKNEVIICKTICHNYLIDAANSSHKLYYYENTKLFKCYTECAGEAWDIFDLVKKIKSRETGEVWSLKQSISFIIKYYNLDIEDDSYDEFQSLEDWKVLKQYKNETIDNSIEKKIEFKIYNDKILQYLPQPHITNWEKENISYNIIKYCNIHYNPVSQGIVIPHYDIDNNLIGIRERTLIKENEEFGKYKPSILNYKMYNHPLGFSLYGINWAKNNIKNIKKAIIFERREVSINISRIFWF